MTEIKAKDAQGLFESKNGAVSGPWTRVGTQHMRTARWMDVYWLVVRDNTSLYGVEYQEPLTENQESEYPWYGADGDTLLPLTPLYARQVTRTEYDDSIPPAISEPAPRPTMNRAGLIKTKLYGEAIAAAAAALLKEEARLEWTENETAISYALPNGAGSGSTAITQDSLEIIDPKEFMAWLVEKHPSEVVTEPAVRNPTWLTEARKLWLAEAKKGGDLPAGTKMAPGGAFKTLAITPDQRIKARLAAGAQAMLGSGTLPGQDDLWTYATEGPDD
jgi:hypothetical protein